MPIYVYQVISDDEGEGEVFEIEQSMKDKPLLKHPATGQSVRRVYQPPNLGLRHTDGAGKRMLDPKNTEKAGFTRYERDKISGDYHKVSGKNKMAPDLIKRS